LDLDLVSDYFGNIATSLSSWDEDENREFLVIDYYYKKYNYLLFFLLLLVYAAEQGIVLPMVFGNDNKYNTSSI
jgi:hypothetical protein